MAVSAQTGSTSGGASSGSGMGASTGRPSSSAGVGWLNRNAPAASAGPQANTVSQPQQAGPSLPFGLDYRSPQGFANIASMFKPVTEAVIGMGGLPALMGLYGSISENSDYRRATTQSNQDPGRTMLLDPPQQPAPIGRNAAAMPPDQERTAAYHVRFPLPVACGNGLAMPRLEKRAENPVTPGIELNQHALQPGGDAPSHTPRGGFQLNTGIVEQPAAPTLADHYMPLPPMQQPGQPFQNSLAQQVPAQQQAPAVVSQFELPSRGNINYQHYGYNPNDYAPIPQPTPQLSRPGPVPQQRPTQPEGPLIYPGTGRPLNPVRAWMTQHIPELPIIGTDGAGNMGAAYGLERLGLRIAPRVVRDGASRAYRAGNMTRNFTAGALPTTFALDGLDLLGANPFSDRFDQGAMGSREALWGAQQLAQENALARGFHGFNSPLTTIYQGGAIGNAAINDFNAARTSMNQAYRREAARGPGGRPVAPAHIQQLRADRNREGWVQHMRNWNPVTYIWNPNRAGENAELSLYRNYR